MYQSKSLSPGTKKEDIYRCYRQKIDSDVNIQLKESPNLRAKQKSHKLLSRFNEDIASLTKKRGRVMHNIQKDPSQSSMSEDQ